MKALLTEKDRGFLNSVITAIEAVNVDERYTTPQPLNLLRPLVSLKTEEELRFKLGLLSDLMQTGDYKTQGEAIGGLDLKPSDLNTLRYNHQYHGQLSGSSTEKVGILTNLRGLDLEGQLFLISLGAQTTEVHSDAIDKRVETEAEANPQLRQQYTEAMRSGEEAFRAERTERLALAVSTQRFLANIEDAEAKQNLVWNSKNSHELVQNIVEFGKDLAEIRSGDHPWTDTVVSRGEANYIALAERIAVDSLLSVNQKGELLIAKIIEETVGDNLDPAILKRIGEKCQTSPTLRGMLTGAFEDAYLSDEFSVEDKKDLLRLQPEWIEISESVKVHIQQLTAARENSADLDMGKLYGSSAENMRDGYHQIPAGFRTPEPKIQGANVQKQSLSSGSQRFGISPMPG